MPGAGTDCVLPGASTLRCREGAFLANNLLFVAFAFVVLLGTVFPLLYEALDGGQQITVGAPYFNRLIIPIGLGLLFLMAVAPALPWRKASGRAAADAAAVAGVGGHGDDRALRGVPHWGLAPLLAFGLGAFAGAAALRQLVLARKQGCAVDRSGQRRDGRAPRCGAHRGGLRSLALVRANRADGAAAARREHEGGRPHVHLRRPADREVRKQDVGGGAVRVDGGRVFAPALTQFPFATQAIGTPSVHTGLREDIYLTLSAAAEKPGDPAVIGVAVQPLVMWLWIGGGLMAFGTLLAAWPGRRRRLPTMPASAPIEGLDQHEPEPVGV